MEPLGEGPPSTRGKPKTMARITQAIANLAERGGSSATDIGKFISQHYNLRTSMTELKRMLIRAVEAGRVKQSSDRSNRFILKVPKSMMTRGHSRRRRRRRGKKGKGKGRRRRRRRGRKGRKGKGRRRRRRRGRKGRKGKGRRGRRRRRRGGRR